VVGVEIRRRGRGVPSPGGGAASLGAPHDRGAAQRWQSTLASAACCLDQGSSCRLRQGALETG